MAGSAASVVTQLESLCREWIAPHTARLRAGHTHARSKVINDPVWGTIRLYSWEAALLDTSLLQRLRYIRQLGVAHWVFPGAGHSRLEHSVGVLHQMQQLIDGLERNSGLAGERIVDDVTTKLLRIAALVHDCGHAAFSHVSESLVAALPGVEALIARVAEEYRARKDPSPSEAFAAVFIRSPAFREFLGATEVGADFIRDVDEAARRIAGYVVAGAVDPGKEYLSLLLNGPFDADKLDYMPRDSAMAGIPSAVDVKRIIEKVHTVTVPVSHPKLPAKYAQWATQTNGAITTLVLSTAGSRALHELAVTKNFLFDKVYQHHKVLALEEMARRLLQEKRRAGQLSSIRDWLSVSDDGLVGDRNLTHAALLRDRRLLKRAFFVKGKRNPKGENLTKWLTLRDDVKSGALARAIGTEAVRLSKLLEMPADPLKALPPAATLPDLSRAGMDRHAFIGDAPEDFRLAPTAFMGERAEAGRRVSSSEGYVFAPEESVLPVFLAARTILSRDYNQTSDSAAFRRAKLHPEEIRAAEEKLIAKGALQRRARNIRIASISTYRAASLEQFLKTAWPRIEALHDKFGQYQVPEAGPVTAPSIAKFLRQFETEALARSALRMLESVDFKDRRYFATSLEQVITSALRHGDVATVSPLGGTGDSSALLSYLMNDIRPSLRRDVQQLELALESRRKGQILLWDDFCGAAGHTKTALIQWLRLKDEALRERLARPLSRSRAREFRDRQITIAFSLGRRSGLDLLRSFLRKHELHNVRLLEPPEIVSDKDDLFSGPRVFADAREREALQDFLRKRTTKILAPKLSRPRDRWPRSKLEDRLLGYSNTAKLLVFYYNVPTVTLTAVWEKGDGWSPLFMRRPKPSA